jgi:hypothetical protein
MSSFPTFNPETLDLIFEHVKDAPEKQLQDVTALDSKYVQVFAGASVILGAVALIDPKHGGTWPTILVAVALGIYLVMAVVSFIHLRTVTLNGSRYGDTLWDDFKDDPPEDVKLGIVLKVKEDYAHNTRLIQGKAKTLNAGLFLTAVEAICVAGAVLASRM